MEKILILVSFVNGLFALILILVFRLFAKEYFKFRGVMYSKRKRLISNFRLSVRALKREIDSELSMVDAKRINKSVNRMFRGMIKKL